MMTSKSSIQDHKDVTINFSTMEVSSSAKKLLKPGVFEDFPDLYGLILKDMSLDEYVLTSGLFAGLDNLKYLEFDNVSIFELTADHLSILTNLRSLYFKNRSSIKSLDPNLLAVFPKLEDFLFEGKIRQRIPNDLFAGREYLEKIYLKDLWLEDIPEGMFDGLSNLEILDLSGNHLFRLHSETFSDLVNLESLNLENNFLRDIEPGAFHNLTNLRRLYLENNKLTELPPSIFQNLKNITSIDLSHNKLIHLDGIFDGLGNENKGISLNLNHNCLQGFSKETFRGVDSFFGLDLEYNGMEELPEDIFTGQSLRLNLSNNNITSLPEQIFSNAKHISSLKLNHNRLKTLPRHIFKGIGHLEEIYLENNRITHLPDGIFDCFHNSSSSPHIYLRYNDLEVFPFVKHVETMIFYLNGNKLPGEYNDIIISNRVYVEDEDYQRIYLETYYREYREKDT